MEVYTFGATPGRPASAPIPIPHKTGLTGCPQRQSRLQQHRTGLWAAPANNRDPQHKRQTPPTDVMFPFRLHGVVSDAKTTTTLQHQEAQCATETATAQLGEQEQEHSHEPGDPSKDGGGNVEWREKQHVQHGRNLVAGADVEAAAEVDGDAVSVMGLSRSPSSHCPEYEHDGGDEDVDASGYYSQPLVQTPLTPVAQALIMSPLTPVTPCSTPVPLRKDLPQPASAAAPATVQTSQSAAVHNPTFLNRRVARFRCRRCMRGFSTQHNLEQHFFCMSTVDAVLLGRKIGKELLAEEQTR